MDIFKEAREFCRERLEPEFLSEEEEKAYREAVAGTPKGKARKEAWRAYWVAYTVHAVRWRSKYNEHI